MRRQAVADGNTALGHTPFRIGLWVGASTTPNSTNESGDSVASARRQHGEYHGAHALQLTRCPWCGAKLTLHSNIKVEPSPRAARAR